MTCLFYVLKFQIKFNYPFLSVCYLNSDIYMWDEVSNRMEIKMKQQ